MVTTDLQKSSSPFSPTLTGKSAPVNSAPTPRSMYRAVKLYSDTGRSHSVGAKNLEKRLTLVGELTCPQDVLSAMGQIQCKKFGELRCFDSNVKPVVSDPAHMDEGKWVARVSKERSFPLFSRIVSGILSRKVCPAASGVVLNCRKAKDDVISVWVAGVSAATLESVEQTLHTLGASNLSYVSHAPSVPPAARVAKQKKRDPRRASAQQPSQLLVDKIFDFPAAKADSSQEKTVPKSDGIPVPKSDGIPVPKSDGIPVPKSDGIPVAAEKDDHSDYRPLSRSGSNGSLSSWLSDVDPTKESAVLKSEMAFAFDNEDNEDFKHNEDKAEEPVETDARTEENEFGTHQSPTFDRVGSGRFPNQHASLERKTFFISAFSVVFVVLATIFVKAQ